MIKQIRTIKQAIQAVKEGNQVIYSIDACKGYLGTLKQSIKIGNSHNEYSLKHSIACLKYDNKPFINARFEIVN